MIGFIFDLILQGLMMAFNAAMSVADRHAPFVRPALYALSAR